MIANAIAAVLVTTCFFGIGCILNYVLFRNGAASLALATGICCYLAVCGILDVTQSAHAGTLHLILVLGIVGAGVSVAMGFVRFPAFEVVKEVWVASAFRQRALITISALLLTAFVVNSLYWSFASIDDLRGYLVLPFRILQEGSASLDPFLYRRVEVGLGASSYLYALLLSIADFTALKYVDLGLGSLLLATQIIEKCRSLPRAWLVIIPMAAFYLAAVSPNFNMSPDLIAVALAVTLAGILFLDDALPQGATRAVLIGLFMFGIVSLKTTYAILVVTVIVVAYTPTLLKGDLKRPLSELAISCVVCAVLMIPWMYSNWQLAGTPYFPFLGFGTLSNVEFSRAVQIDWIDVGRTCLFVVVLLILPINASPSESEPRARLFLLAGITLTILVMASQFVSAFYFRYIYPVLILYAVVFLVMVAGRMQLRRTPKWRSRAALALLVGTLAPVMHRYDYPATLTRGAFFTTIITQKLVADAWIRKQSNLPGVANATLKRNELLATAQSTQGAVPAGASIVALIDAPMFFNFRRNKIYIMDWPGVISPPPGLPTSSEPSEWLSYLRTRHIDYVIYSDTYNILSNVRYDVKLWIQNSPWQSTLEANLVRVLEAIARLSEVCPTVWKDDTYTVLDCSHVSAT